MNTDELCQILEKADSDGCEKLDLSQKLLTRLPPDIGRLTRLKSLILGQDYTYDGDATVNRLTDLPAEIVRLTNLVALHLGTNQLTELPPAITHLTALTSLELHQNRLSRLPREIGRLTRLMLLNVAYNQLAQLPAEIGLLTKLERLSLAHNQLKHLPPEIGNLTNLTSLDFGGNNLTRLPDEIFMLASLTEISLANNKLTQLPTEIGRLTNLTMLILSDNQLKQLPPAIALLTKLTALSLSGNPLTQLPPEMANLTNLTHLELSSSDLTRVPEGIVKLAGLKKLVLGHNQLTQLPPEIGQLTKLETLELGYAGLLGLDFDCGILDAVEVATVPAQLNQLRQLPVEIGQLANLKQLGVRENLLTSLPREIGHLKKLKSLNLAHNRLQELPPEMGQLVNLEELDVSHNQLETLPPQLGLLKCLKTLNVYGNPLTSPPPEIIKQGTEAVLTFLRAMHTQGSRRLWLSKMVVVGQGRVGKTSVLRALRGKPFDHDEPTTHGMNAHEALEVSHPSQPGVKMRLFTWDFGGQEIYHATHQFFLTDRALFLLVWNGGLDYTQCRLEYWLEAIKARAPHSPILIVATHHDERPPVPPPLKEWKEKYNIVAHHEVSNKDGSGIDILRRSIAQTATALPLMGSECPRNWVTAAKTIQDTFQKYRTKPATARNYFLVKDLLELLKTQGLQGKDSDVMVRWYHDLGGLLIYPDDRELKDLVVLNPWWVSRTISRVLDHQDQSLDQGVLTAEHADQIWHDLPAWLRACFLRLMERFDLSYRIPDSDGSSLVVARLPADPPDYEATWEAVKRQEVCHEISLRYRFSAIPAGIPMWFIARSHRFSLNLHWRHGALFGDAERRHLGLVRADPHQRVVELKVRGPVPQNFFALLKDGLELTLARFPGLKVDRLIPCPCSTGPACDREHEYQILVQRLERGRDTIECPRSGEVVSIPQVLFGWGAGGSDKLLRDLHDKVTEGFHRQNAFNQESIALLQRHFLALQCALQEQDETHCPNVFLLRVQSRDRARDVVTQKMKLELFCQAPGHWHSVAEGGRYEFSRPAAWLEPMIPYLRSLVKVLRYAAPVVGAADALGDGIKLMESLIEEIPGGPRLPAAAQAHRAEGAALRNLRQLLNELDPAQNWGGLRKVLTPEGHYLWVCAEHAAEYQR